jgi:hypothetical protein
MKEIKLKTEIFEKMIRVSEREGLTPEELIFRAVSKLNRD